MQYFFSRLNMIFLAGLCLWGRAKAQTVSEIFQSNQFKAGLLPDYVPTAASRASETLAFRGITEIVLEFIQLLIIPIAVVWLLYAGIHLIVSRNSEETFEKAKNELIGMGTGFGIFLLATVLVDGVLFGRSGEIFGGDAGSSSLFAMNGVTQMQGIFRYASSFAVLVATGVLIFQAIKILTSIGNPDMLDTAKKKFLYTGVGLALFVSIETIVTLFTESMGLAVPDATESIRFAIKWANFALGFVGFVAVIALIYAGAQLVLGMGSDDTKDKSIAIFKYVVIGLVVTFSAWTIVHYFVTVGN